METPHKPAEAVQKTGLLKIAIAVYILWVLILAGLAATSSVKPPESKACFPVGWDAFHLAWSDHISPN